MKICWKLLRVAALLLTTLASQLQWKQQGESLMCESSQYYLAWFAPATKWGSLPQTKGKGFQFLTSPHKKTTSSCTLEVAQQWGNGSKMSLFPALQTVYIQGEFSKKFSASPHSRRFLLWNTGFPQLAACVEQEVQVLHWSKGFPNHVTGQ